MLKKWLPAGLIAIAMAAVWISGAHDYFSLETFQSSKSILHDYARDRPLAAMLAFCAVYIAVTALSIPAATIVTLVGGFLFGVIKGTALVTISATIGSSVIFLIAKSSFGEALRKKAERLYKRVADDINDNAFFYILFLRLVPVFPFFAVNILPALFAVPLRTYAAATFLGVIPGTIVYVNLGRQLGEVRTLADLASADSLAALGLLAALLLITILVRRYRKKEAADAV